MSTKPYKSAPHATEMLTRDFLIGIQVGQNTGDAGKAQMKYMTIGELADWIQVNYGAIWKYRGEYSSALPTDVRQNDYFLATGTFTVGGVTYTVNHLYAYDGTSWGDISNVLTQYASQSQVTYIAGKLANVVRHDNSVPTGGVTVNADQLNGVSDTGYVKKYSVAASDWDTVPTNGSNKPVTSDGVYDAINAISTIDGTILGDGYIPMNNTITKDITLKKGCSYILINTEWLNNPWVILIIGSKNANFVLYELVYNGAKDYVNVTVSGTTLTISPKATGAGWSTEFALLKL